MDCIKVICLYLKDYITNEQFESIFSEYINDFQSFLEEDMYFSILFTNFTSKEEIINLNTELLNYVLTHYLTLYENINDSYVEHMIDLNEEDAVVEILKKKYERKEEIRIDCSIINTQLELISAIKEALQFPQFCGNNWHAVEDLIYDIIFPQKLIFTNWFEVEKKLPKDTIILRDILDKNNYGHCVIFYT